MKYTRYCPSTLEKLPHLKNIKKCWQTEEGTYDILYEDVETTTQTYKHLLIQRIDGQPIHNYMDIQEIKNDLLGEDIVAIEVYPKKEDLLNGSNTYHIWTWEGISVPNLKEIDNLKRTQMNKQELSSVICTEIVEVTLIEDEYITLLMQGKTVQYHKNFFPSTIYFGQCYECQFRKVTDGQQYQFFVPIQKKTNPTLAQKILSNLSSF